MSQSEKEGNVRREKQVRKACEKVVRTGERKDLAEYLKMRREDNGML